MERSTIFLTNEESKQFIAFQKHYELFNTLVEKGAFDLEFGKVVINWAYGQPQNIVVEKMVWRKDK